MSAASIQPPNHDFPVIPRSFLSLAVVLGLVSCREHRKGINGAEASDRYNGIVTVQLVGATVHVPHQDSEEWAIRKAIFLYHLRPVKGERWYLGAKSISPAREIRSAESFRYSPNSIPPPPPPPEPPVIKELEIPQPLMDELKAVTGANIEAVSACRVTEDGVMDKETGMQRGCLISIEGIRWLSPDEVEVLGEWWSSPSSRSTDRYNVRKFNGAWRVRGPTWGRFREEEVVE